MQSGTINQLWLETVNKLGLIREAIGNETEQPIGQQILNDDFVLTRILGAAGFPTIVMINEENRGVKLGVG